MTKRSNEIVELEMKLWQSMADKDAAGAKAMIADECLITGPMGTMKVHPDKYGKMTKEGNWTLESFKFSDVEVVFPADDVAVIAYKVRQIGEWNDKPMDMHCADATTWVHNGDAWKCSLHSEAMMEQPQKSG